MKIETSEIEIRIAEHPNTFSLTVDGTGEPEQALDLLGYVLRYGEPVPWPTPPAASPRDGDILRAARAFADAHEAHRRDRSGTSAQAKIRTTAALLAAVAAAR